MTETMPFGIWRQNVLYRIAYLTLCIQDSLRGRELYADLAELADVRPDYIHFGSADWFWEQTVNTYCIHLEPDQLKSKDSVMISLTEALITEELRPTFFNRVASIVHNRRV